MPLGGLHYYYMGAKIVISGLALLVFSFGLFIFVALVFHIRLLRSPTPRSTATKTNWRHELRTLYITSVLILVRSVYRLVEYSQGNAGWLMRREWTLYVFDTLLMFGVLVVFNIWHPSKVEAELREGMAREKAEVEPKTGGVAVAVVGRVETGE